MRVQFAPLARADVGCRGLRVGRVGRVACWVLVHAAAVRPAARVAMQRRSWSTPDLFRLHTLKATRGACSPFLMAAIHDLSALEQAAEIRKGNLSPVDVTDHYLRRVEQHNAATGAFITVTADDARRRATEDERTARESDELPPLHGVPIGFKDLHNTRGVRTTMGSRMHADHVPEFDDHAVALLKEAGVNSLGKTNVPEFGYPFHSENLLAPPARTPWDLTRSAGGSSGGAGAAVAAGLLPIAHASDGGGSLRVPASVCGLFGIKPSRGRVSNGPASSDVTCRGTHGPLSRTVADGAAMLDAMTRFIPTEIWHAPPLPPGETFLSHARRTPGRLRIGRYITPCMPDVTVAEECVDAWESASTVLAGLGHEVEDIDPPFAEEFWHLDQIIHRSATGFAGISDEEAPLLTPLSQWMRQRRAGMSVEEFLTAMNGLRQYSRRVITKTSPYDALLTPTVAAPPRPVGWFTDGVQPEETLHRISAFSPFTGPYNVTGQPAVNLPLWWSADGLPIGVMLAGRPYGEATLLQVSAQLEQSVRWRERMPDIWGR